MERKKKDETMGVEGMDGGEGGLRGKMGRECGRKKGRRVLFCYLLFSISFFLEGGGPIAPLGCSEGLGRRREVFTVAPSEKKGSKNNFFLSFCLIGLYVFFHSMVNKG